MRVKSPTSMNSGKALKVAGLATILGLAPLAVKGQTTEAQGVITIAGTGLGTKGIPIGGVDLEARVKGTDAGFNTTTWENGYWVDYDIPITGEPNSIFDRKAQFANDKLQVEYGQGQIKFRVKTDDPLHFGTIYNTAGKEINNLQFYEADQGVFEAIWQPESNRPTELFIFKDEKGRAAKVTPWAMSSGEPKFQEVNSSAVNPSIEKGATSTNETVTYTLKFTHSDYETLFVETDFIIKELNHINLEMSPKLYGQFRAAIETSSGEFLPGKIVLTGLDVDYKDSTILDALPVHDFTQIPIDESDGITSLRAMVVPTSVPFDTAYQLIDILEGDNPFQSLIVNKTGIEGKRINLQTILGQSDVPAENYRVIIRDEDGNELYNGMANDTEFLTPKIEEGSKVTLSAYFPSDDPLNRDETHAGFLQIPINTGTMDAAGDTIYALPLRFKPLEPIDPYTNQPVPVTPEWLADMDGGSYNLSFWDDGIEDIYLHPNVDTTAYKELISYINSHFGINIKENWVDEPIEGDAYGINVTDDPNDPPETTLVKNGNSHIRTNIELGSSLIDNIKERAGRWYEFTTVTKRDNSFMKAVPSLPTPEDRAIVYDYVENQKAINSGKATYNYIYAAKTSDGGF